MSLVRRGRAEWPARPPPRLQALVRDRPSRVSPSDSPTNQRRRSKHKCPMKYPLPLNRQMPDGRVVLGYLEFEMLFGQNVMYEMKSRRAENTH